MNTEVYDNIFVNNSYSLILNDNVSWSWPRDERKIQVLLGPLILVICELTNEQLLIKLNLATKIDGFGRYPTKPAKYVNPLVSGL